MNAADNKRLLEIMKEATMAREQFILGNIANVKTRVNYFIIERPELEYLRDDLLSVGYSAVVNLANKIGNYEDIDYQGLIGTCILNAIRDFVRDETRKPVFTLTQDTPGCNNLSAFDLLTDILDSCESKREREVVSLRVRGYTDEEIAEKLLIGNARVCQIRQNIFRKWQEV